MSAVDAVTVEAVLESRAECSDAERARAALSEALVAARAPAHGGRSLRGARPTSPAGTPAPAAHWTVTMTVAASGGASSRTRAPTSVEATIMDDAGRVVAQRTITDRSARACLPLARAVGAWASLVLDAEMNRATDDDGTTAAGTGQDSGPSSSSSSRSVTNSVGRSTLGFSSTPPWRETPTSTERSSGGFVVDRPGAEPEKAPPRSIEIGSLIYLRNGMTKNGGIAGIAPFVTVEVATGWVLRPGVYVGRGTAAEQTPTVLHLGTRVDICRRIPGNYIERRGIEADFCAGLEGGVVTSDGDALPDQKNIGRLGIGPSANLRGELGAGFALEVRGLFGANMIQYASLAPLVYAAGEFGVSWRLP